MHAHLTEIVEKGEKIATLRNIFGDIVEEYFAPEKGVIIGKNVNPVSQTGGRILHLGILEILKSLLIYGLVQKHQILMQSQME